MSRYRKRVVVVNNDDLYYDTLQKRNVKKIYQYSTPTLTRPTDDQLESIKYQEYSWTVGDRFWRIAEVMYGDKSLWWVIARFNNKPTEGHLKPGDLIKIPTDIIQAVEVLR